MTYYPPYQQPAARPPSPGGRRGSGVALGFGIASLVLGTLGVLTICIPIVPLLIAGVGMVLALVGLACSARRGGVVMPIIGAIVCAVPIVLVVGTYVGLFTLAVLGRPGTPTGPGPTTTWVTPATAPATTEASSAPTAAPTPESSRESDSQYGR